MEFTAIIKKTKNAWYIGQCEQVPGALTQGRTVEEVKENLKEAIALILEDEKDDFIQEHKGESFIRRKVAELV
jgi:predicted RNase H-like HicB family nuclease